ncbi:MAG: class I SAM-dependent methyltransferase [Clostridia bacterium]|nr:class I SAM-dependent methyltransferase [Clostridia bacterium]
MTENINNYWNNRYWTEFLNNNSKENLDFLSDLWLDKYSLIFDKIKKGKAIDLGCGLGQYTEYLINKGFDVVSCDISSKVLSELKEKIPNAKILEIDMSKSLPFESKSLSLVFANLSIHYFDTKTTENLIKEIKRILKDDGYFVGSVNSSQTYKFIKEVAIELEPNYYQEKERFVRLFTKEQFDYFFKDFDFEILDEVTTTRWNRTKIMWEFIAKLK